MATRRDQLHSYQFLTQRVISAFVMRETDPAQSPLRRGIGAAFAGIMVAVIVGAGFGIYGLLTNTGNDAWRTDGSVVVEKDTGATYVYAGGVLHPTLNYTSALLAAGRPNPTVHRVATKALTGVTRGVTVGIEGAPASLPRADSRAGLPWSACTVSDTNQAGQPVSRTTLLIAEAPAGARELGDDALLVADAKLDTTYLVWHGLRFPIAQSGTTVPALFGAVVSTTPVSTSWLNTLARGETIGPLTIEGRGSASAAVPDHRVGDLLVSQSASGPLFYLVFADGLATLTPLQKALVVAQNPGEPDEISVQQASTAPRSRKLGTPAAEVRPPATVPTLANRNPADPLCAVTRDAKAAPTVSVGGTVAGAPIGATTGTATRGAEADGTSLADRVLAPAGRVSLVRAVASPTAGTGSYFFVTDLGIKYGVPGADVLPLLGFSADLAVNVPNSLVSRLPTGPVLDPAVARSPVGATD
ncbi:type VII secretion protein EccB [Luedemannella flava]|uniref:Type VII secretion protein EccB n=1 Tax=Luedemannella flava TaxID=349316 RepID=A0ABN2MBQ5_9ACTN